MEQIA